MDYKDIEPGRLFFHNDVKYLKCSNNKSIRLDTYDEVEFSNIETVYESVAKPFNALKEGDIFIVRKKMYMVVNKETGLTIGLENGARCYHSNNPIVQLVIAENYPEGLFKIELNVEFSQKYKNRKH